MCGGLWVSSALSLFERWWYLRHKMCEEWGGGTMSHELVGVMGSQWQSSVLGRFEDSCPSIYRIYFLLGGRARHGDNRRNVEYIYLSSSCVLAHMLLQHAASSTNSNFWLIRSVVFSCKKYRCWRIDHYRAIYHTTHVDFSLRRLAPACTLTPPLLPHLCILYSE